MLANRADEARKYLARLAERSPGYALDTFLGAFRFDREAEQILPTQRPKARPRCGFEREAACLSARLSSATPKAECDASCFVTIKTPAIYWGFRGLAGQRQ